jgi:hypothetical protein
VGGCLGGKFFSDISNFSVLLASLVNILATFLFY